MLSVLQCVLSALKVDNRFAFYLYFLKYFERYEHCETDTT